MSIKLTVGCMRKRERFFLHARNLEFKTAELASLFNPDLIIMDGRRCFVTRGPFEGKIEKPNMILASGDRIAIDVEGIKIIQSYKKYLSENKLDKNPWELTQIKRAVEMGIGVKNEKDYKVLKQRNTTNL